MAPHVIGEVARRLGPALRESSITTIVTRFLHRLDVVFRRAVLVVVARSSSIYRYRFSNGDRHYVCMMGGERPRLMTFHFRRENSREIRRLLNEERR